VPEGREEHVIVRSPGCEHGEEWSLQEVVEIVWLETGSHDAGGLSTIAILFQRPTC